MKGFVECTKERTDGPHDSQMNLQRWMVDLEAADLKLLTAEKKFFGPTQDFEESRIGLEALESVAEDLNCYVKFMKAYYKKHPDEKPWSHHEPPSTKELGIEFQQEGWTNSEKNKHYWNHPRTFCEPEFRILLVPAKHFTPKGPRRGMIGISLREHYDRDIMIFNEHPKRSKKQPRTEAWNNPAPGTEAVAQEAAGIAAGTATSYGSGRTSAEPSMEPVMEEA